MFLARLQQFANSWVGFIFFMLLLWQGMRYEHNHSGQAAFAATGLPLHNLAQAKQIASANNQLIVAELSAYWCGTCQQMDRKLFTQPAVNHALSHDFVYARIDADSDEAPLFMQTYGAQGYPTLVLLNSSGQLIKPLPLTFDDQEFLTSLAH